VNRHQEEILVGHSSSVERLITCQDFKVKGQSHKATNSIATIAYVWRQ